MAIKKVTFYNDGVVINGSWPCVEVLRNILLGMGWGKISLTVADPPYGRIVDQKWDRVESANLLVQEQIHQLKALEEILDWGDPIYWFGGVGKPGFRPFYQLAATIENETNLQIAMHVTWGKKRAYGVRNNYLFTREEILYLVRGDYKKVNTFNIPYLKEIRGYEGYNPKYPAKDARKRRTAVWTDVTEILRGKLHECQKPHDLLKIPIETHTSEGDVVLDLFSGSGQCAVTCRELGRRFVSIEEDTGTADAICRRLGTPQVVIG